MLMKHRLLYGCFRHISAILDQLSKVADNNSLKSAADRLKLADIEAKVTASQNLQKKNSLGHFRAYRISVTLWLLSADIGNF